VEQTSGNIALIPVYKYMLLKLVWQAITLQSCAVKFLSGFQLLS